MTAIKNIFKQNQGFTLIELIIVLIITSIIGLGASYFFVYAVENYTLAKANNESFQKVNIAMERLIRETERMNEIYQISSSSMRFERDGTRFGLAFVGDKVRLIRADSIPNASQGSALIDNVNAFSLSFQNSNGTNWSIPTDNSITGLAKVTITLQLSIQNTTRTFTVEINPLYNNMINGPTS